MKARAVAIPVALLLGGVAVSAWLLSARPTAPEAAPEPEAPLVRTLRVEPETVQLRVRSQGSVVPRTESRLVAEVPGRVLEIAPGLEPGAFFREGELLARLDPRDFELARDRARAALERAGAERDFAEAALARQQALRERGIASDAILDETRRAARIAAARRAEARVDLARAERDLARAEIVAPFEGRTRQRSVDVGGFVASGSSVAEVYAVDYADVRLPIPDAELAFLELPLGAEIDPEQAPRVELSTRFAGERHTWHGRVLRTEAEIDPRTRMVTVVARVPRPYATPGRPPLAAGLFVDAEILGRRVEGVARVPRAALDDEDRIWIVDAEERLRRRPVEVLRFERDTALVVSGLAPQQRVSLLPPRLAREGLRVRSMTEEEMIALGRADAGPSS